MAQYAPREQAKQTTQYREEAARHESADMKSGPKSDSAPRAEALKEDLDALLDEVDAILEENREHLESYVQKGGE